jgi:isopenicillin N synthase-like dioxygenase
MSAASEDPVTAAARRAAATVPKPRGSDDRKAIPLVSYATSTANRAAFVAQCHDALANTGFMLLSDVDGLGAEFQRECFGVAHAFFELDAATKMRCSVDESPHFRGFAQGGGLSRHMIEAYQIGLDRAPLAPHDDRSAPLWKRIYRGPNVWPDERDVPGFRATLERLHARYFALSRELGHVMCEALGIDAAVYDSFFDLENPDMLAALNHNFPLAEMPPEVQAEVRASFEGGGEDGGGLGFGAHVDGAPFVTLLIADSPGLQALALDGKTWLDVPVIPGTVVVNIGATLMKLSGKQLRATVHRVNPLLQTGRRCSLPYFLLPKLEGELVPFGAKPSASSGGGRDRGLAYAVDRMNLFGSSSARWYGEEVEEARQQMQDDYEAYQQQRQRQRQRQHAADNARL